MTASWKAEGRLSEAWVVADPEIIEIFLPVSPLAWKWDATVPATPLILRTNGAEHFVGCRKSRALEDKLERAREAMPKKTRGKS